MAIKIDLINALVDALEQIQVVEGFSQDVSLVRVDNVLAPHKLGVSNRDYVVQLGITNEQLTDYGRGSDQIPARVLQLTGLASTFNRTYLETLTFIEEIEDCLWNRFVPPASEDYQILDWELTRLTQFNVDEQNPDKERMYRLEINFVYIRRYGHE